MQTHFTAESLRDPSTARSARAIRTCVHCGFCTATCPTYVLLGDELDSPRGRIELMRAMLEKGGAPAPETVRHIDRCLSCLACTSTCPSGVDYRHLIDHARAHIEKNFRRTLPDRALRALLAFVLPRTTLFRAALLAALPARALARHMPARLLPARLAAMLALAPARLEPRSAFDRPGVFPPQGQRRYRVALLAGCAQRVLAPAINDSTIRLLTRLGVEIVIPPGAGCCGALAQHMGRDAHHAIRANVMAWDGERARSGLDAVLVNASGCGSVVKLYGQEAAADPELAEPAARISALTRDISEFVAEIGLPDPAPDFPGRGLRVAYHGACSLQHGQRVHAQPRALLRAAGFVPLEIPQAHLCCGSAGTYNLLQPEIAAALGARKVAAIESIAPDLIVTGNIGCLTQIRAGTAVPVVHLVELLDWATGGPIPSVLALGSGADGSGFRRAALPHCGKGA